MLRLVLILPAALLCAVWPQGLVLCMGEEGHLEFELQGSPCCPEEGGEDRDDDCRGCSDSDSPDLVRSATDVPLARVGDRAAGDRIDLVPAPLPERSMPPAASPPLEALSTVVLVV